MSFYLDTNIFYHRYCPGESNDVIDWLFAQLNSSNQAITCEITISEMFRAIKMQYNLGVIERNELNLTLDFFITDIRILMQNQKLKLIPISLQAIMKTRNLIVDQNLYAVDAIHGVVALNEKPKAFITLDSDFKTDFGEIQILNPLSEDFKEKLKKMIFRIGEKG
ncbi:MAG: type II toxin-antitoxin system VapC family toxin [Promethearchaeota archaeon]